MTLHHVAVAAKDGAGANITGGIRQNDTSGTGAGPNVPEQIIVDSTGAEVLGTTADAAVITDTSGSAISFLRGIVKLLAAGISVGISNANANGRALPANSAPVVLNSMTYQDVAASQVATVIGTTGAVGDYLDNILIVPEVAASGTVTLTDGSGGAITIFAGGSTTALPTLAPFTVAFGQLSKSGAWKIATGSGVHVRATGNFT